MRISKRVVAIATVLFAVMSGQYVSPGDAALTQDQSHESAILLVGETTPADLEALAEAERAFDGSGLLIPTVQIHFGLHTDECLEGLGRFRPDEDRHVVLMCTDEAWVLIHELAHAWIHDNVGVETRNQYMDLRGLATWNSSAVPWNERGFEDAAFVMQQLLLPRPALPQSPEWDSRRAAFALLTGFSS